MEKTPCILRLLVTKQKRNIVAKGDNLIGGEATNEIIYLKTQLSSVDLKTIQEKVKVYQNNQDKLKRNNQSLAGNLEKEFLLDESFEEILFPYLVPLADRFNQEMKPFMDNPEWHFISSWINFQKKYEFNPLHDHLGNYSFVLWVKVPYDLKEEQELQNCIDSNSPKNSLFCFYFPCINGRIRSYELYVDKSWEGTLILFPSTLAHMVYPFYTSDDYRISISGNLMRRPSSKKTFSYQ